MSAVTLVRIFFYIKIIAIFMTYFYILNTVFAKMNDRDIQDKDIKLVELSQSPYGVLVARMLPSYLSREVNENISAAHRHDYYSLILLEAGNINMTVDFQPENLKPSSMLLLRPGQVHHTNSANNISGWIILFDGNVIDQDARFAIEQSFHNTILLQVDNSNTTGLSQMLDSILKGTNENQPGKFHKQFLQSLLNAFLFKTINLLYLIEADIDAHHPSRAVAIVRKFNQLVKLNFRKLKRPFEYAEQMNMTSSYLNDTIKTVTGFSCTYIIQQELIGEAKRLLFYTSKSVKEIAFELGYHDHKYFIRQFGNVTKTTPSSFRKDKTLQQA